MSFKDSRHVPVIICALAVTAILLPFAPAVTSPLAFAAVMAAPLAAGTLLGLAAVASCRNSLDDDKVEPPSPTCAAEQALSPEPDDPEFERRFAAFILQERLHADEPEQPPRLASRNR